MLKRKVIFKIKGMYDAHLQNNIFIKNKIYIYIVLNNYSINMLRIGYSFSCLYNLEINKTDT